MHLKKKVLIFGVTSNHGGVETFAENLIRLFHDDFDFSILKFQEAPYYHQEFLEHKFNIKTYDIKLRGSFFSRFKYASLTDTFFQKNHFDLVHINANSPFHYFIARSAIKHGCKVIYESHNSFFNSSHYKGKIVDMILPYVRAYQKRKLNALGIVPAAVSDVAAKFMFSGRKLQEVSIIPNYFDAKQYKFSEPTRLKMRQHFAIENEENVVLVVSRVTHQKNFEKILSIFQYGIDKGFFDRTFIVGDGDEFVQRKEQAQSLPDAIKNKIYFVGSQNNVQDWMSMSDEMIMPSFYEGLPYTLLEAQANGLPSIVSDVISRDSNYSGLVSFLSLQEPDSKWVYEILKSSIPLVRRAKYVKVAEKSVFNQEHFKKMINKIYQY
ncbi:MAG: glycosyltransferase [Oenococcus oeni]